ncbi:phage terminase small subunit [Paenibacillus sp. FA6]|uniref:phage terminase small subunit n=1 Tax=Paenibacillus sp. FA6 TaxID=3413029 RepID=UPI003F65CB70
MARERSPDRKKALSLWFESGKEMKPAEIAAKLGINSGMVRKWKSLDKWEELPDPRPGAPHGNRNAKGNKGGPGGPIGNDKAVTHGLFRKFLPDDKETQEIYDLTADLTPLDILWESIRIQLTNIIRALSIQHVTGKDEMIKELKRAEYELVNTGTKRDPDIKQVAIKEEFEFQFAWDRSATGLKSMAAAWTSLTRTIKQYDDALRLATPGQAKEEYKQRIEQIKANVAVLNSKVPNRDTVDMNNPLKDLTVEELRRLIRDG